MDIIPDQRIIMHIDMNSYFATCEQQDNPAWRGHPVGVCEHLGGIIIAASIEAKRWGIKTGTPVWEARRIYPKIFLTKTNPDRYRKYTARFLKVFADYTGNVEKYSIDEAFLDVTKACNVAQPDAAGTLFLVDPWDEATRIAKEIKARMPQEVGDWIKCSIGIGSNKLLAKLGSDMQKPDGLTVIRPKDVPALYDRLSLTDIPGIGKRMERQLNKLGIKTLNHLRDYPYTKFVTHFGIQGYHLWKMGQLDGSWKEGFAEEPLKSIGHMYTLPQEWRKKPVLEPVLYKLCEMVAARLRVNGLCGSTLHVHIHDPEWNCIGASRRLGYFLDDGSEIFQEAMKLLLSVDGNLAAWQSKLYLIGITVASLKPQNGQTSLFERDIRRRRLTQALDKINNKYEDFTIARVPAFLARDIIRDSVGFGRMKEFKTSSVRGSHGRFG